MLIGFEHLVVAFVIVGALGAAVVLANLRLLRWRRRFEVAQGKTTAILAAAVDSIITIDDFGLIEGLNPAAETMFGYHSAELIGRNVSQLMPEPFRLEPSHDPGQDRNRGHANIIAKGREVQGRRKDGSVFPADLTVGEAAIGGRRLFTGIVRDITERRRAEEALKAAKERAEQASVAQSRFFAAASHDLRQPVQALTLFAAALGTKITGSPAAALLEDMNGSIEAMKVLLDALLDVSRLDAGVVVPHETTFSLATVIDRLTTEFGPQVRQKELEFRVVPTSAVVRTDPTLLYRILQNFLSNAVRYTSDGRILLGCRRHRNRLIIEVVDTGIGIPECLHGLIFKEFFQAGNSERDRSRGLGLGLAIVERLGRLLHSPISMRSTEGRGSAFRVEVPLVGFNRTANVVALHVTPGPASDGDKSLIFIIDDEPAVLKGLKMCVEDWGYAVLTARTELEAIQHLNREGRAPDLVIADYRLRGICTGAQLVIHIRQLFNRPIPGILITGDTAPGRIRDANNFGMALLHKPIQPPDLLAAIIQRLAKPGIDGIAN